MTHFKKLDIRAGILVLVLVLTSLWVQAGGISVNAGLTPAQEQWIFRAQTQVLPQYATLARQQIGSIRYQWPIVATYGVRPELTLITRNAIIHQRFTNGASALTGIADPVLFAKYKLFRINKPEIILGGSPGLGFTIPIGSPAVNSNTWDSRGGFFFSARKGLWSLDLNLMGHWPDFPQTASGQRVGGPRLTVNTAVGRQILLGSYDKSLAPVLEMTYHRQGPARHQDQQLPGTRGQIFSVAPGLQYIHGAFVIEGLFSYPICQDNRRQAPRGLIGIRWNIN
jgi:hypothetical protein